MLTWTLAVAMAADPVPTLPFYPGGDDPPAKVSADDLPPLVAPEAPPEAEALTRDLSMRHAVPCDELSAGLAEPVPALRWAVATIQQPPWAAMHAAECLTLLHADEVTDDLTRWVRDPALKGLGIQTLGLLPQLSEPVAVKVTEAALTGNLADRARKAALDDAREAVRQVGSK